MADSIGYEAGAVAGVVLFAASFGAVANGLYSNDSWQFDTAAETAYKASILDLIERKKNGYYEGFDTTTNNTIYNNTNIGTQINCSNAARATGNEASNRLVANSPNIDNTSGVEAVSAGSEADNSAGDGGLGPGGGSSSIDNDQSNSGVVSSNVDDSDSASYTGPINSGSSQQELVNDQANSGDQVARLASSTACDIDGTSFSSTVDSDISGPLNG